MPPVSGTYGTWYDWIVQNRGGTGTDEAIESRYLVRGMTDTVT
jgi:hypothetical protein